MPRTLDGRVRTVLAVVAIGLVLIVSLALLFAGGGDDGDESPEESGSGLLIERFGTELLVTVEPTDNVAERAGGARSVTLRCVDADDQLVAAQDEAWPFAETDGGTLKPHAHVPLEAAQQELVSSCRLVGTEPLLEGSLPPGP
jgi:hypothetical protein